MAIVLAVLMGKSRNTPAEKPVENLSCEKAVGELLTML